MIDVQQVEKRFGATTALDGVTFSVGSGELVALIGHNGAGKSTAIKILTGQLLADAGSATVGGRDLAKEPALAREQLGYVPEDPRLYDYLTAREFLELVIDIRGHGELDYGLQVAALGEDADRLIREYSQGMRRRTALAAAMVARPQALVLDEALNGLDPPSAARVKDQLREARDRGSAILLSTHVLDTVERLADRVVMLAHGRVVADERVADIGQAGLESLFLERIAESMSLDGDI